MGSGGFMLVRINATAASIGIQASHVEPPSTFSFEGLHSLGSGASVGRPRMVNVQCDEPGGCSSKKSAAIQHRLSHQSVV